MCGIAGRLAFNHSFDNQALVNGMLDKLTHRGPDDRGAWQHQNLVLGHTRLSIHDLSLEGHQPMLSECGQHVLIFNGEIYNYLTLKSKLTNFQSTYRGSSDTEILLACLKHWGIEKTLAEIDGMFAFAYWSAATNKLFIARDRMGEKPLYWHKNSHELCFASELKALTIGITQPLSLCREAISHYLTFNYIPAPLSIYQHVKKLLPGHFLTIDLSLSEDDYQQTQYYKFEQSNADSSEVASVNKLKDLLIESVDQRLVADVPLGAFLSGGIDSSLVVALAKQELGTDISTFTIGFNEPEFDESLHAVEVAKHLRCKNHIEVITEKDMLDIVPNMAQVYSEPFADSSQLPTYLLCEKTKQSVTVALSGDGGDELFGGYSRYHKVLSRWNSISKLPLVLRKTLGIVSQKISQPLTQMDTFVREKEKLRRSLRYYSASCLDDLYIDSISSTWDDNLSFDQSMMKNISEPDCLRRMMLMDSLQYLPDDIFVKVDRASMAHALEVRVPLMSKKILAYSQTFSTQQLVVDGKAKWPLREILYQYIPTALIERPKKGFAVPIRHWLKKALKPWAESLINDKSLQELLFDVEHQKYQLYWQQHLRGQFDWSTQLWTYLQLLSWLKTVHRK